MIQYTHMMYARCSMKQIRSVLQSESKNSAVLAAVKIQHFYKRYTERRYRHEVHAKIDHLSKGKKKTMNTTRKTKKVKADPKPITFDAWTPADCLSLLEIAQLGDSSERLTEFITTLQAGVAMTKVSEICRYSNNIHIHMYEYDIHIFICIEHNRHPQDSRKKSC